ncbi:MAG: hypothetical protein WCP97_04000 [bacterium]
MIRKTTFEQLEHAGTRVRTFCSTLLKRFEGWKDNQIPFGEQAARTLQTLQNLFSGNSLSFSPQVVSNVRQERTFEPQRPSNVLRSAGTSQGDAAESSFAKYARLHGIVNPGIEAEKATKLVVALARLPRWKDRTTVTLWEHPPFFNKTINPYSSIVPDDMLDVLDALMRGTSRSQIIKGQSSPFIDAVDQASSKILEAIGESERDSGRIVFIDEEWFADQQISATIRQEVQGILDHKFPHKVSEVYKRQNLCHDRIKSDDILHGLLDITDLVCPNSGQSLNWTLSTEGEQVVLDLFKGSTVLEWLTENKKKKRSWELSLLWQALTLVGSTPDAQGRTIFDNGKIIKSPNARKASIVEEITLPNGRIVVITNRHRIAGSAKTEIENVMKKLKLGSVEPVIETFPVSVPAVFTRMELRDTVALRNARALVTAMYSALPELFEQQEPTAKSFEDMRITEQGKGIFLGFFEGLTVEKWLSSEENRKAKTEDLQLMLTNTISNLSELEQKYNILERWKGTAITRPNSRILLSRHMLDLLARARKQQ